MKKIFVIGLAALALVSCNMDFYSSDAMTGEQLAQNPDAPLYTTDGIYTYFQDRIAYKGQDGGESGNYYVRHYFQMSELRGDNVTVSGITEDPFINPYRYTDDNTAKNIYYTWWMAYKIIYAANSNIEYIPETSDLFCHLIGENYFFRALAHFQMVTLFAMPYADGRENPGVPLRTSTDTFGATTRATVGEVYDQVVADLIKAKEYLAKGEAQRTNGSKAYVTLDAARALLARVYLYMDKNDECIAECNELLDHAPAAVTGGYDYADYPTHTFDHPETIWCIRLEDTHEWAVDHGEASIASMYIKADGIGWGEHYWREDLIDLFRRYPEDKRFKAYFRMVDPRSQAEAEKAGVEYKPLKNYDEMEASVDGYLSVVYPVPGGSGEYCTASCTIGCKANKDGSVNFKSQGEKIGTTLDGMGKEIPVFKYYDHVAKRKVENGKVIYYVENSDPNFPGKEIEGVKRVWIRPGTAEPTPKKKTNPNTGEKYPETQADANARYKAAIGRTDNGGFYMRYYNTKFSGQGGKPMMTSPVFLRWGEVFLNRAEALAKKNRDAEALADVNVIRSRAGIPELSSADISGLGYKNTLDLVLDERRMELCFEGHRFFDVFRNRLPMDRRYVGYHTWEIIQPGDPRIAVLIPQDEINSSGIAQNPR